MVGSVAALADICLAGLTEMLAEMDEETLRSQGLDPGEVRAGWDSPMFPEKIAASRSVPPQRGVAEQIRTPRRQTG